MFTKPVALYKKQRNLNDPCPKGTKNRNTIKSLIHIIMN